jgi:hypothetical protein
MLLRGRELKTELMLLRGREPKKELARNLRGSGSRVRELHREEVCEFCSSLDINGVVKWGKIRWEEHIVLVVNKRHA